MGLVSSNLYEPQLVQNVSAYRGVTIIKILTILFKNYPELNEGTVYVGHPEIMALSFDNRIPLIKVIQILNHYNIENELREPMTVVIPLTGYKPLRQFLDQFNINYTLNDFEDINRYGSEVTINFERNTSYDQLVRIAEALQNEFNTPFIIYDNDDEIIIKNYISYTHLFPIEWWDFIGDHDTELPINRIKSYF